MSPSQIASQKIAGIDFHKYKSRSKQLMKLLERIPVPSVSEMPYIY